MDVLPPEIFLAVLDHIEILIDTMGALRKLDTNLKDIRNCSLVCRRWAGPAQLLLYRKVSLLANKHFLAFADAITKNSPHARFLANAVLSLTVFPFVLDIPEHNRPSHSIMSILSHCHRLKTLHIPSTVITNFTPIADLLRQKPFTSLNSLYILQKRPDDFYTIYSFFLLLPSLTFLHWEGRNTIREIPQLPQPAPFRLECLILQFPYGRVSADAAGSILHDSSPTLHTLTWHASPPRSTWKKLIELHGRRLRRLRVTRIAHSDDFIWAISQFSNLQSINLDAGLPEGVAEVLPVTLQSLIFGGNGYDTESLRGLMERIPHLPDLREIVLALSMDKQVHKLDELKKLCAQYNVEVQLCVTPFVICHSHTLSNEWKNITIHHFQS